MIRDLAEIEAWPKKVGELEVRLFGMVGSGLMGVPGDYSPPVALRFFVECWARKLQVRQQRGIEHEEGNSWRSRR